MMKKTFALCCGFALLTLSSCSVSEPGDGVAGKTEFVWGKRQIFGVELPIGAYRPGLGVWVARETATAVDRDVEINPLDDK